MPDWPDPPEDAGQERSEGAGECPCFIRVRFIRVGGDSSTNFMAFIAPLLVDTDGKDLYHAALEVQLPERRDCPKYVIELQGAGSSGSANAGEEGREEVVRGSAPVAEYVILRWKNGRIEDGDDPEFAHPGRLIVSRDCNKARELLDLVSKIPPNDYGTNWTSNSIVSWLLERTGLDPSEISPPVGGILPGWQEGIDAASAN